MFSHNGKLAAILGAYLSHIGVEPYCQGRHTQAVVRRKAGDKQATDKNTGGAEGAENTPNVQADHNSVAIGGISGGRDLSGSFTIGYTVGQVSHLLTQITSKYQQKPFDGRCPYKGLEVFEEEDAELFFERERLVEDLVNPVDVLDLVVAMLGNPLAGSGGQEDCGEG